MAMSISEAAESLREKLNEVDRKLGEPDVFTVTPSGGTLVVDVAFIYRADEIPKEWEGYPVRTGKRSCW